MALALEPVGHVRGGRAQAVDDNWGDVRTVIELDDARFGAEALAERESFSHLVVIFHFHAADPAKIELLARHPRNNLAWPKAGIFAQRGKNRPNHLGVSTCQILKVEGTRVFVQGLEAIDGTPVLDLKLFMRAFEPRAEVKEPAWAGELMANYW